MRWDQRIAVAVVSCALGAGAAAQTAAPPPVKIGVFDPNRVFEQSEVGKKMRVEIDALTQKKRTEVQGKEEEIKVLQEKYKQEEPSLSEDKRAERERALQQKGIELKRLRDDATREVQQQVSEVEQRFQKQVLTVVEQVGRDDGYTVILDRASLVFSAPAADITDKIVARLNAAPVASGKSR
jgi:outer membrane protein